MNLETTLSYASPETLVSLIGDIDTLACASGPRVGTDAMTIQTEAMVALFDAVGREELNRLLAESAKGKS